MTLSLFKVPWWWQWWYLSGFCVNTPGSRLGVEVRAEGGEGGAVCELAPFLFESAGNGDGGVGELDAGEEVADAGLDGRDAPEKFACPPML